MSRLLWCIGTAGVLLATPGTLPAQDTLLVEQGRVDGSFIEGFSVVWLGTRTFTDGTVARFTVEEEYEVVGEGDDALLKMTQVWNDTTGTPLFTSVRVGHRRSMEYRAFHTGESPGVLGHLDFEDGFVSGMYAGAPEERIRSFGLELDTHPFATMSGVLVVTFPLETGAVLAYPGMGWGGRTNPVVRWNTVEVVGREPVAVTGRDMTAWKVQAGSVTYWLSREAPYFLRAEAVGGNGAVTVFEIESWAPDGG